MRCLESPRRCRMSRAMLIRKGTQASFDLEGGATINAPRGSAMLHDPTGRAWGANSALFVRLGKASRPATEREEKGTPEEYLGRNYRARVSTVTLPPRALSSWERIGRVTMIWYQRTGSKARGYFKHPFGVRSALSLWQAGKLPTLYRRGDAMRLELGAGSRWDDRGIVFP